MRLLIYYVLLAIGVGIVFYLSWLPSPDLSQQWFMPGWLGRWTNEHDRMRTAVPFFFLGILTGIVLEQKKRSWRRWLWAWLGLVATVSIAETGQLFLPHRVFDLFDIVWGAFGAFTGMFISFLFLVFYTRILLMRKVK
jgi:hypothetical protein